MRYVRPLLSILILICLKTVAPAQGPPRLELVVQTGHTDRVTSAVLSGDGSEGVERYIAYRKTGTLKLVDDDATRKHFHRPGLLAQVWKGEK